MTKAKLSLSHAQIVAERIIYALVPHCDRLKVAGSIRREKEVIGDIEIVCIPRFTTPAHVLIPGAVDKVSALQFINLEQILNATMVLNGAKYKKMLLVKEKVMLDLFIVTPPAQWGVIFTIRTGGEDFSHRVVATKQTPITLSNGQRTHGLLPSYLKVRGGCLMYADKNEVIDTPEEEDFFKAIKLPWISPTERN